MLGAGPGLGGGAGIGGATGSPHVIGGGRGVYALVGGIIGFMAGAGVGATLPTGGWHTLYRGH